MANTPGKVDRLYLLNGGLAVHPDCSIYTPGRWKDERVELCCHAYLIKRDGEWILWDTGIDDRLANDLGGQIIAHDIRGIIIRSLARQLDDIGITPANISRVILSHGHFDHIGNAHYFGHANWIMHRREYEAMFSDDYMTYGYSPALYAHLPKARVQLFNDDFDVFGDDSIRILATPGHTPGHCSLLVRLAKTGPVLLSADVAHYRYNLDNRCVPLMNSDAEASHQSMNRLENVASEEKAQIWFNHDIVQAAGLLHAPMFYD